MFFKRIYLILGIMLGLLALTSCNMPASQPASEAGEGDSSSEDTATESDEPLVLRYADSAADLNTLDPHFAAGTQDRNVVDMVFNGLLRYKPGDGSVIEPDLAAEMPTQEVVDGKQIWTFTLREGVMCHASAETEAYELTSEDVVYSLEKSANPDRSAFAGEYSGLTFEAIDDYTVQITLEQPISEVLFFPKVSDYAGGFVVCKQPIEAMGDETFKTNPAGTGPFVFESYSPQNNVMLAANEDYFRGRPLLDGVEYRYMPELNSRELGLLSGELDAISGATEGIWVDRLSQEDNVIVDVYGVGEVATVHFNTSVEPLDNPLVRKALAYAMDRDEFLALFGEPVSANVFSPVPAAFLPGGLTEAEAVELGIDYSVDREQAKALLEEAGYPDGFSLKVVSSERDSYLKNYQSMQAQFAEIGVDLEIEVVDHSSMHSLIRDDTNPIVIYVSWRPNADVYLTRFYHSDSTVVTGAKPDTNFSHYAEIDDLIEAARVELDPDAQIELWKEAQIKLLEDMIAHTLQYQSQVTARTEGVDFGHDLVSVLALYPQINETTTVTR